MWKWVAALSLLPAMAAAQELKPEKRKPDADLVAGTTYEGLSHQKRPYWYRVPNKIDEKDPPNLLVMMHGTGLHWRWSFYNYPIHTGQFRPDDFVVSPESKDPGRGFVQGKPDRVEVAGLIKLFKKTWPIGNVYLYGHSQGAFFCYYFAGEEPEMIDGVIAHAGNFFKAKFNKAARDRVGIGILHGRADAVVTVDCAFRTDLLYRDAGYAKVRLFVVDGLTKQSGHWPLPWHANQLLDWLDQVSIKNAQSGVRIALRAIAAKECDLSVVCAATRRSRKLMAGDDRDLAARLEALEALVDRVRDLQIDALLQDPAAAKPARGPWATHLRLAQAAFKPDPAWREATRTLQKQIALHGKQVAQATKALGKESKRSFGTGLKAAQKGFLAENYDHLLVHLQRWSEVPGKKVGSKDLEKYRALAAELKKADEQGKKAFAAAWSEALAEFREKYSEWLEPYKKG